MVSTSKARQIIYNPNDGTYNPDFSKEPMVLTPELYITGSSTNVIATAETVKWYVRPNTLGQRIPIENNDTYSIGNDFKLTISKNIMKDMLTMEFILEVIYKEPDSDFRTTIPHHIELVNISMGEDGDQGIPGKAGADGRTPYLHIAYANIEFICKERSDFTLSEVSMVRYGFDSRWVYKQLQSGTYTATTTLFGQDPAVGTTKNVELISSFSTTDSTNKLHIGQYTDYVSNDSTSPGDYSWSKIKGDDSATLAIITPDGTTVRDTTNSLRLDSKLFVGGKEVTASSYKWYYFNGSSTVTHSTSKSTSIGATIIKNSLPIFLDATYNGTTYTSSVTINDISDVYTSIILGVATFKNGKGSNTYTVKLYRNGEEIDPGGSIYSYEWEKLNSQGVKDTRFTKTGKTITITANDIDNTNLFNCYIYTK